MMPLDDPPQNPDQERLARIKNNLAAFKAVGASREEINSYLADEHQHVLDTTRPEQNVWEKSLPYIETFLSGVPGANKAVSGFRSVLNGDGSGGIGDPAAELRGQRDEVNTVRAEHPGVAMGLQALGSLAIPVPGAGVASGGLETAGRLATTAAVGGGAAGMSEADLQGKDVMRGGSTGALTALATTGVLHGAGAMGKAVLSPFRTPNAEAVALDKVRRLAQNQTGGDLPAAAMELYSEAETRRAAGGQPMAFELLGDQGKRTLRAATTAPFSKGGEVSSTALNERAGKVADRADDAILRGSGMAGDEPGRVVDQMVGERSSAAEPLYDLAKKEAANEAAGPYASAGPAMKTIRNQLKKNTLLRTLIGETKQIPDLVDARPDSYEVLDDAFKSINGRIRDAKAVNDNALATRLDKLRAPLLDALSELAPTYRKAATTFAQESVPLESFAAGQKFRTLDPYEIQKALGSGKLANGNDVDPAAFRAGVAQDLRALIGGKAGSQSLEGAATHKNPLATLNNRELDRQLSAALGEKYDAMIPTFREILREEANRGFVTGGSNTANKALDDPELVGDALSSLAGGIGFGPVAATRRAGLGLIKDVAGPLIKGQTGKRATETARKLTLSGSQLDDLLRQLTAAEPTKAPSNFRLSGGSALARLLAGGTQQ